MHSIQPTTINVVIHLPEIQLIPSMLKFAICISALLILLPHVSVATENNDSIKSSVTESEPSLITSIYESLYSAIEMDSSNEIKQFISFGADVNHRYIGEKTPLMLASSMGSIETIQALLQLGANPNLVSAENMTAMDYAEVTGDNLIIAALYSNTATAKAEAESETILIKKIQFLLGRLGYNAGEVDGDYGKRTQQSLANFAEDTKQTYPTELSTRQVESLKNVFFQQDFNEVVSSKNKTSGDLRDKRTGENVTIIKTIP